jgi:protein-S-isoprenylcysteine O-methyltransferase Ste14
MQSETENKNPHKNKVHKVLAHAYLAYLFFFLLGVCFNLIFNLKVFNSSVYLFIGFLLLIFGTFLILSAQKASRNLKKENISRESFSQGPYRYTRIPTNFGLFFLVLGFGFIVNSFFIVLFSLIAFLVAKFAFLNRQEKILAEKYGAPYLEYKKTVKF